MQGFPVTHQASLVRLTACFVVMAGLAACSTTTPLEGTWETSLKNKGSSVWLTFKDDKSYELDYRESPGKDLWGRYSVSGEEVTLVDEGRAQDREVNSTPGLYKYKVDGETARFTVLRDKNTARSAGLQRQWTRRGAADDASRQKTN